MDFDNPAARLLAILKHGKAVEPKKLCRRVWHDLLNAEGDESLLVARVGKVMQLPQLSLEAVQQSFPGLEASCSHWVGQVDRAFMEQNINGIWETFIVHIDGHTLNYLEMTAKLLGSASKTAIVGFEQLLELRERLQVLLGEVLAGNIDPETKQWVATYLRKLITAIDEYQISGTMGIVQAVDAAAGHAYTNANYASFLKHEDLGKRVAEAISVAANLVTVATGLPAISHAAQTLIAALS